MMIVEVNNKRVEAKPGEMILSVARRAGIKIPTLCHLEGLTPSGHCRLCVVEVEGTAELLPACATPVTDGMQVRTNSKKVQDARNLVLDMIIASHPADCLHCIRNRKCELQYLSVVLGTKNKLYKAGMNSLMADDSSPSVIRDYSKCVLCGRCVRVCSEIQSVYAVDYDGKSSRTLIASGLESGIAETNCVGCGQCIIACPTAALKTKNTINDVQNEINNPQQHVVAMISPSVGVSVAEEFGLRPGVDATKILTSVLFTLGFDRVFDMAFAADINIMEHSALLSEAITKGTQKPLIRVCSSSARKFIERNFPELTANISTCKTHEQMMGSLIKTNYAKSARIKPDNIFTVSISPCTAGKSNQSDGQVEGKQKKPRDVDAVLTTRELIRMVDIAGINVNSLLPENQSLPYNESTTSGRITGVTGGFSEAVIRTTYEMLTGKEYDQVEITSLRGIEGRKEARIKIDEDFLNVASVSGLRNAGNLLREIIKGKIKPDFVEITACPAGCIAGGGQPKPYNPESVKARMKSLYFNDKTETIRVSHKNKTLTKLYSEWLGFPLSRECHKILHINH